MAKKELTYIETSKEFSIGQKIVYRQRRKENFTLFKHYKVLNICESNHLLVRNDKGRFEIVNPNCFVSLSEDRNRKIKLFNKWDKLGLIQ